MKPLACRLILALAGISALVPGREAHSELVDWWVDPSQSFVRLSLPDQVLNVDGTTATVRVRDANNDAWSDAGGRKAVLAGSISTEFKVGQSIQFNGGMSQLFAAESGTFRPDPAEFDPHAFNGTNPYGQYSGTGSAPAAFAAKIRGSVSILTVDLAYIALREVSFDLASGMLPLVNATTFAGGDNYFGIQSAQLAVDGQTAMIIGQRIPDDAREFNNVGGMNPLGGTIAPIPSIPWFLQLTLPVNVPIAVEVNGTVLNFIATGQIVATHLIPEPSSLLLAGLATVGLCCAGRRRLRCFRR